MKLCRFNTSNSAGDAPDNQVSSRQKRYISRQQTRASNSEPTLMSTFKGVAVPDPPQISFSVEDRVLRFALAYDSFSLVPDLRHTLICDRRPCARHNGPLPHVPRHRHAALPSRLR